VLALAKTAGPLLQRWQVAAPPLPDEAEQLQPQLQRLQQAPPPLPGRMRFLVKARATEPARLLAIPTVHVRRELALALAQRPLLALRAFLAEESRL
jgi:hypothetical protein